MLFLTLNMSLYPVSELPRIETSLVLLLFLACSTFIVGMEVRKYALCEVTKGSDTSPGLVAAPLARCLFQPLGPPHSHLAFIPPPRNYV